jgi:hypothetical protein
VTKNSEVPAVECADVEKRQHGGYVAAEVGVLAVELRAQPRKVPLEQGKLAGRDREFLGFDEIQQPLEPQGWV